MRNALPLILAIFCLAAKAQYYDDAQLRQHINLEKELSKRFSLSFEQQNRWTQNFSRYSRASFDLGLNYKMNKYVHLCADYVFIQSRTKNNGFSPRHWFSGAVVLKKDIHRWKLLYRNLVQARFGYNNDFMHYRLYDRNKVTIKYEATKRFLFYTSEELYLPLNSPQVKGFDRSRTYLGTNYKLTKSQVLEFYFLYQVQLQKNYWFKQNDKYDNTLLNRSFIYGIGYSVVF